MAIYRLLKNRAFGPLCHPPTPGVIQTGRPLNAPCPSMKFVCASGATDGANARWLVWEQPVCVYDAQIDIGEAGDIAARPRLVTCPSRHSLLVAQNHSIIARSAFLSLPLPH
jgi:hypothetical protein